MDILKYYINKRHPEMEPFPVLKSFWQEPESVVSHKIKELGNRLYHLKGYQQDETTGAYPELDTIPMDDWPEEIQDIWEGYEKDIKAIKDERDTLYEQILDLEKNLYDDLDPFELSLIESEVDFELRDKENIKKRVPWGYYTLIPRAVFRSMCHERNEDIGIGIRKHRVPIINPNIELVSVRYANMEDIQNEVKRLADHGIGWIEEQERLLLDLVPMGHSIDSVIKFNKEFVQKEEYKPLMTDKFPARHLAILTCMDTRLTVLLQEALGLRNGDAKIIKNAGGIIPTETDTAIRSLLVAIYELGVNEVMVIHHSTCGACHMSYEEFRPHMLERGIPEETLREWEGRGIGPWLEGFHDTEASVRRTVAAIVNHPLVPKDVTVRGFIIDSVTGELTEIK